MEERTGRISAHVIEADRTLKSPGHKHRSFMNDFRDMADKAKAEHQERIKKEQEARSLERDARAKEVARGVEQLRAYVVGLLDEAKAAFAAQGIETVIRHEFDVKNFVSRAPSVQFHLLGPVRQRDGYRFETAKAEFSSNGEDVTVKYPKEFDEQGRAPQTSHDSAIIEMLVKDAVKATLNAYYKQLEEHQRRGTL